MSDINFATVELFAADLRGSGVDHSEVKKLMNYMRSQRSGRALFEYLQYVIKYPKVVERSNQTAEHFQTMLRVSEVHLRPLQHDYRQLMVTLGWGYRLLRYYKDKGIPTISPRRSGTTPTVAKVVEVPVVEVAPTPPRTTGSSLLQKGEVFRGTIIQVLAGGVKIQHPDNPPDRVLGVIDAEHMGKNQFKVKNTRWVEILAVNTNPKGLTILELRPSTKPE